MSPREQKIICKKGTRNAYMFTGDREEKQYTITVCGNASGDHLPLYMLYKGKHSYSDSCRGAPPGKLFSFSESGWMETDTMMGWFSNVFLPFANRSGQNDGNLILNI
jgi:hypothetical protein